MADQEQARAGKGSHEAKDAQQDHPKGHQHSQKEMPSRERGDRKNEPGKWSIHGGKSVTFD